MAATDELSAEERAELEALRKEKAAREREAQAARERIELEELKADAREQERIDEAKARGRALMEPGDDLAMPTGQKFVIAGVLIVAIVLVLLTFFGA